MPEWARQIVLEAITRSRSKYLLRVCVVMPDHVHLIHNPLLDEEHRRFRTVGEIMQTIKGFSVYTINRRLGRQGQIWQIESFDRVLRSGDNLDRTIDYILQNPVRKGLVLDCQDYRWLWREIG